MTGELTIETRAVNRHEVVVLVRDTGPGIPAERMSRIFRAIFYHQIRRARDGTGYLPVNH